MPNGYTTLLNRSGFLTRLEEEGRDGFMDRTAQWCLENGVEFDHLLALEAGFNGSPITLIKPEFHGYYRVGVAFRLANMV